MSKRNFALVGLLVFSVSLLAGCVPFLAPTQVSGPAPWNTYPAGPAPQPARLTLRLATTTSTADSGLLDFILPEFEQQYNAKVDVIAVGTGQALELGSKGDADVVLVHSRRAEDRFVAAGHARERFDVMHNDFIVVGPEEDPASVAGMTLARDAFKGIVDAGAPFVSRGDGSGTYNKEMSIWASLSITPTAAMRWNFIADCELRIAELPSNPKSEIRNPKSEGWYNAIGQGMGDTLLFANELGAYTLTDRGTYLSMREKLPGLAILVGGEKLAENRDKALLNIYGVMAVSPDRHPHVNYGLALKFVEWLLSAETQEKIGGYGMELFGQPLFYPASGHRLITPSPPHLVTCLRQDG
jgi:tungstate transport system substrate-binding protein